MKNYFFILLLFLPLICFSQDILLKKNGDELNVKVDNVLKNVVTYSDSLGQHSISRDEVFMIRYADGSKEIFTTGASTPPPVLNSSPVISYSDNEYFINGFKTSETVVNSILKTSSDPEIVSLLKKKSGMTVSANFLRYSSIPVGIAGTVAFVHYINNATVSFFPPTVIYAGIGGFVGLSSFALMQVAGVQLNKRRTRAFNTAIDKFLAKQNQQ